MAKDIGDKVQVVIDGARCFSCRFSNPLNMLSDGKVAAKDIGYKVQCVDEKVQVVIDGARGLSSCWLNPSNIHTFRRQASKSCSTRNKIGYATGCQ